MYFLLVPGCNSAFFFIKMCLKCIENIELLMRRAQINSKQTETAQECAFASLNSQVSVLSPLGDPNRQLPGSAYESNSSLGFENPVTVCLIHSLDDVVEAGEASLQRSKNDIEQVGAGDARVDLILETF